MIWAAAACAVLLIAALAVPLVMLQIGRDRATRCLASIEQPRGPTLPSCERHAGWFAIPAKAPWTHRWAHLFREELVARMAIARYVDAAVGTPDRTALAERFAPLGAAAERVAAGTGRLRLAQLGPSTPAPRRGPLAASTGNRRALVEHGFEWTQWYVENHALEAALLEGARARAVRLAEHYAGRPDPELRLHLAALLCLGGEPARGLEHAASVEQSRAAKRNANMARSFGEARVLVEECAARAKIAPPPVPAYGGAGEWDQRERYDVMRLRHARRQPSCDGPEASDRCSDPERLAAAVDRAVHLLRSGVPLSFRLELAAAVAPFIDDAETAVELLRPREGERSSSARAPLTLRRVVERDEPGQPRLTADELTTAAEHLLGLGPSRDELQLAAGVLLARAAAGYAGLGQRDRAMEQARRAAELAVRDELGAALLESSVAFVAGAGEQAVVRLRRALEGHRDAVPAHAAARIQLAELLAATGKPQAAVAEAVHGEQLARQAHHAALVERAAWIRLAVEGLAARQDGGSPGVAADAADARLPRVGPPNDWVSSDTRLAVVDEALAVWKGWLAAAGQDRLAHRYAAFRGRGDAPRARTAHLVAAGLLVDAPDQVEPWLDAFYALDRSAISLRGYAWARACAAAWRDDAPARRRWTERYRTLERWAQHPTDGELFQRLRL